MGERTDGDGVSVSETKAIMRDITSLMNMLNGTTEEIQV